MGLGIGNLQSVMRRYRADCPDAVGDRGCEAFQGLCRGMETMEEMGTELERRLAEMDDFLDGLDQAPEPPDGERTLHKMHPVPEEPSAAFEFRFHGDRTKQPEVAEMAHMHDFDAYRDKNGNGDGGRKPDEATRKRMESWTPAVRAVSGMEEAVREVDRLLELEVRTAETFKKGKQDLARLADLQSRPRVDRAALRGRQEKARAALAWCEATLNALKEESIPFMLPGSSPIRDRIGNLRAVVREWLSKHNNSRNGAVVAIEKKVAAIEAACAENERKAAKGREECQRAYRSVEEASDRLKSLSVQLADSLRADDGLGNDIENLGAVLVSMMRNLEQELTADSSKQQRVVQSARRGENWEITIAGEAESKHLRVARRMEGVAACRAGIRAVEAVQPPLEALGVETLNRTNAYPPFVTAGETVYTHSGPGVELPVPVVIPFPFRMPLCMPTAAVAPMLLRLAWTLPAGKLSFIALDQETLGENLRVLNGLGDCPGLLRVVTTIDAIREELTALQAEIASTTREAFKGDIRNWGEYNAAHPGAPLPCKILVIHSLAGFERGFGLSETLANVLKNGPRCGVFAIVAEEALGNLDEREAGKLRDVEFRPGCPPPEVVEEGLHRLHADVFLPDLPENAAELAAGYAAVVKRSLERPAKGFGEIFAGTDFWTGNASKGFDAVIGWDGRNEPVRFCLGDRIPHALLGGATGSGKSNLIHILIHALCHKYSPEELNLYLLDYKDGLEFQKYVGQGTSWLPHARTISTVNDPGYALTLFAFLKEEQKRRKRAFGGLSGYVEYRAAGKKMPRIVVVIDEFHKMFEGMAVDAVCDGLTDIFKQGRAYGIHLVLATQTLNGLQFPGKKGMLDQIGIRLALHSNTGEDDILQAGNTSAKDIKIPQCILNEAGGNKGANKVFSLPHADHESAEGVAFRKRCAEGAKRKGLRCECRVFDGMRLPKAPSGAALSALLAEAPPSYDSYLALGVKNEFLARPFVVCFDDEPGGHLLVCGENGDIDEDGNVTGLDVWNGLKEAAWRSLAAQGAGILHYDPLAREKPATFPREGIFVGAEAKDDKTLLKAFEGLMSSGAPQKFVIVENYGRARLLHPEAAPVPLFGNRGGAAPELTARSTFLSAFAGGSEAPFHAVLFIHNFENTRRSVLERNRETNILAGCAKRIVFNLSKADMENAMPRTRRMDTKGRVLYCDETQPDAPVSILAYSAG